MENIKYRFRLHSLYLRLWFKELTKMQYLSYGDTRRLYAYSFGMCILKGNHKELDYLAYLRRECDRRKG